MWCFVAVNLDLFFFVLPTPPFRWSLPRTQSQMEKGLLPQVSPEDAQQNFRTAIEAGKDGDSTSRNVCLIILDGVKKLTCFVTGG